MKDENERNREIEKEDDGNKPKKLSLNTQNYEILPKKNERIILKNFLQALHRRLQKKKWTRFESIEFFIRKSYVWGGLNALLIPQIVEFGDQKNWLPQDTLIWKILLYSSALIASTAFDDYIIAVIKDEYRPVYSREEQVLYREPLSMVRQLSKKFYALLFIVGFAIPFGFTIFECFENSSFFVKITGIPWLDNLLSSLSTFPIYLGLGIFGIQITGIFLLNYVEPLHDWALQKFFLRWRPEAVNLRFSQLLVESLRRYLLQVMENSLRDYRNERDRLQNYQESFKHILKLESLTEFQKKDIFEHLQLLIAIVKDMKTNTICVPEYSGRLEYLPSFKKLLIIMLTITQIIFFLFFSGIEKPDFFRQNFLLFLSSELGESLSDYAIPANILSLILYMMVSTFLFKKTLSWVLNKNVSFLKCFFHKKTDAPIVIQHHPYAFILNGILSTSIVVFSLPFNTFESFPNWVLRGYDNEFDFETVQYTSIDALLTLYLPCMVVFGYLAYPVWRVMKSAFKHVMWYFSSDEQRREIQLEQYIKTVIQLIKTCKPDPFLETLFGISNQQLQQLFNQGDFEALLEEVYRQKGVSTSGDDLYCQIKERLLKARGDLYDEEQGEIDENDEAAQGSSTRQNDQPDRLRPRETIRLIIEMRKCEVERAQRHSGQRHIQEDESEPLLPASNKHFWLSPSWCRTARCTLY